MKVLIEIADEANRTSITELPVLEQSKIYDEIIQ